MPSLFLGKIGKDDVYEIHALTKDLPFREFLSSEIADAELFNEILKQRYILLEDGIRIFCTAISPDVTKKIEINPHDEREGTVHIVALDKNGKINNALSIAVDKGDQEDDCIIGLPLENRWRANGYPEGARLDTFRDEFLKLNYDSEQPIQNWEMCEFYRQFRARHAVNDVVPRAGIWFGCYNLLFRKAIKKNITPTWIWVFTAIPSFYNLYRWVGAAVLRNKTIGNYPRWISPGLDSLAIDGNEITYKGEVVSRNISIPSLRGGANKYLELEQIPFIDGLVDMKRLEDFYSRESAGTLMPINYEGFGISDNTQYRNIKNLFGEFLTKGALERQKKENGES